MDLWMTETEMEFDCLRKLLDMEKIRSFTSTFYHNKHHWDGSSKLQHLTKVSSLAGKYASRIIDNLPVNEQQYTISIAKAAGLLHESLQNEQLWYEDVVELADEAVAKIVCSLTEDRRYLTHRYLELYLNQIGIADQLAQLVKLADLKHDLFLIKRSPNLSYKTRWLQVAKATCQSLNKLKNTDAFRDSVRKLQLQVQSLLNKRTV